MVGQKSIEVLDTFNLTEVKAFQKFILSPYFNEREELVQLFQFYLKNRNLGASFPAPEKIWTSLFKSKKYDALLLRRLFSDLFQLCRRFISIQNQEKEDMHLRLLEAFNQADLDQHFLQEHKKLARQFEQSGLRNQAFYLSAFRAESIQEAYLLKQYKRSLRTNLAQKDFYLDCFFLSAKLKHYCNALNYKNVLNTDIPIGLIDSIMNSIKDSDYLKEPAIRVYYLILLTLQEPEQAEHFHALRQVLSDHDSLFPIQELRDHYIFAQNYCIKKINLGQQEYLRELFDLYQKMLTDRIIFADDELPPTVYKNVITLGLRLEEFDQTEAFIRDYHGFLPEAHQTDSMAYNLAKVHFHKSEYDQVIEYLRDLEYRDVYYAVDGRWLLAKTYYETDELEVLDSLLDSFRLFLMRQKVISSANKTQYLKQVRYLKMLAKTHPKDQKRLINIKAKIQTTSSQAEKGWFLEKVDSMLNEASNTSA